MYHQNELVDIKEDLFEETRTSLMKSTWVRIRARVGSQNIVATYSGLKRNGDIMFTTNSGTRPGVKWHCTIRFANLDKARELYTTRKLLRRRAVIKALMNGDIQVYCDCTCWKYYFKHTAWKYGYGIKIETTPAKIRNPHNEKSLCKHLYASLLLLADIMNDVYKDMEEKGIIA